MPASRMTDPNENASLQQASYMAGTMMKLPDNDLDLLCSAIAKKVPELEVARIHVSKRNHEKCLHTHHQQHRLRHPQASHVTQSPAATSDTSAGSIYPTRSCHYGHSTQIRQPHHHGTLRITYDPTGLIGLSHGALAQRLLLLFQQDQP